MRAQRFSTEGVKPLVAVPPARTAQLDANAELMASYVLRATPALVWKDARGAVQMRQGAPEADLAAIFGPR